jgi:hypothetical protein
MVCIFPQGQHCPKAAGAAFLSAVREPILIVAHSAQPGDFDLCYAGAFQQEAIGCPEVKAGHSISLVQQAAGI